MDLTRFGHEEIAQVGCVCFLGDQAFVSVNSAMGRLGHFFLQRPVWVFVLVIAAIVALPIAVWFDLRNLSDKNLQTQALTVTRLITTVRSYYARNVIARVLSGDAPTQALHNYRDVDGAIPIPATLSIELGDAIGAAGSRDGRGIAYRFVSDFPFINRPDHELSAFEYQALAAFRKSRDADAVLFNADGTLLNRRITIATPVVLAAACVECHNTHPESPKRNWSAGDVRGIQTVSVHQPIGLNIWSFKWILAYLTVAGSVGIMFAALQFHLARSFERMNAELSANNTFLADVSLKISRYISPQIYRSIFAGERDSTISTERKKLTVFFSDIEGFTKATEWLQPEEVTARLNEYFTEMSKIAEAHGGTIDKFIGDALVVFFGDPETKGDAEDARACLRMALEMQARLAKLNEDWREHGYEHPFLARVGINTGYCNVGNFGSETRMDYTIIGAEANLAARLQSIAPPGGIVMSYETWALCRDVVEAKPMVPTRFKGIAREVVPYQVVMPA